MPVTRGKKTNWLRNFGKSMKFSAVNVLSEIAPATMATTDSMGETLTHLTGELRGMRSGSNKVAKAITGSPIYNVAKEGLKNALKDIKSGNINNQARIDKLAESESAFQESDFDFNAGDSDFNFDPDGGGEEEADIKIDAGAEDAARGTVAALQPGIAKTASNVAAGTIATIEVGKSVGKQSKLISAEFEQSRALAMQQFVQGTTLQKEMHQESLSRISSINENVAKIVEFNSETMDKFAMGSLKYYEDSLTVMNNMLEELKLRNSFLPKKKDEDEEDEKNPSSYANLFNSKGAFKFNKYGAALSKNLDIAIENDMFLSMMKNFLTIDNLKILAANPLQGLSDFLVKKAIPDMFTQALGEFDKTLGAFMPALMGKLTNLQSSDNPFKQFLGNLFGLHHEYQSGPNMAKYERDAVPFDGLTHKTINTVIPNYLSGILAAVTGMEEKAFNYDTGTFQSKYSMKKNFEDDLERTKIQPFAKLMSDTQDLLKQTVQMTEAESRNLTKQLEQLAVNIADSNEGYNARNGSYRDLESLGITDRSLAKKLETVFRSMATGNMSQRNVEVFKLMSGGVRSKGATEDYYKALMADPSKMLNYAHVNAGLMFDSNINRNEKGGYKVRRNSPFGDNMSENGRYATDILDGIHKTLLEGIRVFPVYEKRGRRGSPLPVDIQGRLRRHTTENEDYKRRQQELDDFDIDRTTLTEEEITEARERGLLTSGEAADNPSALQAQIDAINAERKAKKKTAFGGAYDWIKKITEDGPLQSMRDMLASVLQKPLDLFSGAVNKINEGMYNIIFGVDGDPDKSIVTAAVDSMKRTFDKFSKWMKGKITNAADWLFGKDGFRSTELYTFAKAKGKAIFDYLVGTDKGNGKREGGAFSEMFNHLSDLGLAVRYEMFGTAYKDSTGKEHAENKGSIFHTVRDQFKKGMDIMGEYLFGKSEKGPDGKKKPFLDQLTDKLSIGYTNFHNFIFGTKMDEGSGKAAFKDIMEKTKKRLPKAMAIGIVGAGLSLFTNFGILGTLFLPGGPIGGAILGTGIGLVTQSERFKKFLFGEKDDNGKRKGGLIGKSVLDWLSKHKTALVGGAMFGAVKGLINMSGFLGLFGKAGYMMSMFLPGGPVGGAIMGAATGLLIKSQMFQNMLYGKVGTDGAKMGGLLNNSFAKSIKKHLPNVLFGSLTFGLAAIPIGQMGLMGAMLTPGGPIGMAILGAAAGIAVSSQKFRENLFGKDLGGGIHKSGIFDKVKNMFQMNVTEPFKLKLKQISLDFKWWFKESIAAPFMDALEPLKRIIKGMVNGVMKMFSSAWNLVVGGIKDVFSRHVVVPLHNMIKNFIINPMKKLFGGLFDITRKLLGIAIGSPFKAMAMMTYFGRTDEDKARIKERRRAWRSEKAADYAKLGKERGSLADRRRAAAATDYEDSANVGGKHVSLRAIYGDTAPIDGGDNDDPLKNSVDKGNELASNINDRLGPKGPIASILWGIGRRLGLTGRRAPKFDSNGNLILPMTSEEQDKFGAVDVNDPRHHMDEIRNGGWSDTSGNVRIDYRLATKERLDRIRGRNLAKFGGGIGRHRFANKGDGGEEVPGSPSSSENKNSSDDKKNDKKEEKPGTPANADADDIALGLVNGSNGGFIQKTAAYLKGKKAILKRHRDEINARHEQTSILAKIDKRLGTHFGLFSKFVDWLMLGLTAAWGLLKSGISWLVGGGLLAAIKQLLHLPDKPVKEIIKDAAVAVKDKAVNLAKRVANSRAVKATTGAVKWGYNRGVQGVKWAYDKGVQGANWVRNTNLGQRIANSRVGQGVGKAVSYLKPGEGNILRKAGHALKPSRFIADAKYMASGIGKTGEHFLQRQAYNLPGLSQSRDALEAFGRGVPGEAEAAAKLTRDEAIDKGYKRIQEFATEPEKGVKSKLQNIFDKDPVGKMGKEAAEKEPHKFAKLFVEGLQKAEEIVSKFIGKPIRFAGGIMKKLGMDVVLRVIKQCLGRLIGAAASMAGSVATAGLIEAVLGVWNFSTGMLTDAARLFGIRAEDVTMNMRVTAAIVKTIMGCTPCLIPAIILEVAGMMVGIDAEQFITRTVYSVIASDEDIAALEQKSESFKQEALAHYGIKYDEKTGQYLNEKGEAVDPNDLDKYRDKYNREVNRTAFEKGWSAVKDTASNLWEGAKDLLGTTSDGQPSNLRKGIANNLAWVLGADVEDVENMMQKNLDKLHNEMAWIFGDEKTHSLPVRLFSNLFAGACNLIFGEGAVVVTSEGVPVTSDKWSAENGGQTIFDHIGESIRGAFDTVVNGIKKLCPQFIKDMFSGMWKGVKRAWSRFVDWFLGTDDKYKTREGLQEQADDVTADYTPDEGGGPAFAGSGTGRKRRFNFRGNGITSYSQLDPSIADNPYGSGTMADSGCAVVTGANILSDITGSDVDPMAMAGMAEAGGYIDADGTGEDFFSGIGGTHTSLEDALMSAASGNPNVVLGGYSDSDGAGSTFTRAGHYTRLVGVDGSNAILSDPRGDAYSRKVPISRLANEVQTAYTFSGSGEGQTIDTSGGGAGDKLIETLGLDKVEGYIPQLAVRTAQKLFNIDGEIHAYIKEKFEAAIDFMKEKFFEFDEDFLGGRVGKLFNTATEWLFGNDSDTSSGVFPKFSSDMLTKAFTEAKDLFFDGISNAKGYVVKGFKSTIDFLFGEGATEGAITTASMKFKEVRDTIEKKLNESAPGMVDGIKNFFKSSKGFFDDFFSGKGSGGRPAPIRVNRISRMRNVSKFGGFGAHRRFLGRGPGLMEGIEHAGKIFAGVTESAILGKKYTGTPWEETPSYSSSGGGGSVSSAGGFKYTGKAINPIKDSIPGSGIANAVSERTGFPASWILAQMKLEGGADLDSTLATHHHNYSGIKTDSPDQQVAMAAKDGGYFRHFISDEEFINKYANTINAFDVDGIREATNLHDYVFALGRGGYYGDGDPNDYFATMNALVQEIESENGMSGSGRGSLRRAFLRGMMRGRGSARDARRKRAQSTPPVIRMARKGKQGFTGCGRPTHFFRRPFGGFGFGRRRKFSGKGEGGFDFNYCDKWESAPGRTYLEGVQQPVVDLFNQIAKEYYEKTGEKLLITGAAEDGHATGPGSHPAGWKLDIGHAMADPGYFISLLNKHGVAAGDEDNHYDLSFSVGGTGGTLVTENAHGPFNGGDGKPNASAGKNTGGGKTAPVKKKDPGLMDYIEHVGKIFGNVTEAAILGKKYTGTSWDDDVSSGGSAATPSGGSAPSAETTGEVQKDIWKYLRKMGASEEATAGIMGNFEAESSYNPDDTNPNGGAYGIAQWFAERKDALREFAGAKGKPMSDLGTQLEFFAQEDITKQHFPVIKDSTDMDHVADYWMRNWEKPSEQEMADSIGRRISSAHEAYNTFHGSGRGFRGVGIGGGRRYRRPFSGKGNFFQVITHLAAGATLSNMHRKVEQRNAEIEAKKNDPNTYHWAVGPNNRRYEMDDVNALMAQGMTEEEALKILEKDPKYTTPQIEQEAEIEQERRLRGTTEGRTMDEINSEGKFDPLAVFRNRTENWKYMAHHGIGHVSGMDDAKKRELDLWAHGKHPKQQLETIMSEMAKYDIRNIRKNGGMIDGKVYIEQKKPESFFRNDQLTKEGKYLTAQAMDGFRHVVAPNGKLVTENDINYLISQGYTREAALDFLFTDAKYKATSDKKDLYKLTANVADGTTLTFKDIDNLQNIQHGDSIAMPIGFDLIKENGILMGIDKDGNKHYMAPNGNVIKKNDIDYLLSKGYDLNTALATLYEDKHYRAIDDKMNFIKIFADAKEGEKLSAADAQKKISGPGKSVEDRRLDLAFAALGIPSYERSRFKFNVGTPTEDGGFEGSGFGTLSGIDPNLLRTTGCFPGTVPHTSEHSSPAYRPFRPPHGTRRKSSRGGFWGWLTSDMETSTHTRDISYNVPRPIGGVTPSVKATVARMAPPAAVAETTTPATTNAALTASASAGEHGAWEKYSGMEYFNRPSMITSAARDYAAGNGSLEEVAKSIGFDSEPPNNTVLSALQQIKLGFREYAVNRTWGSYKTSALVWRRGRKKTPAEIWAEHHPESEVVAKKEDEAFSGSGSGISYDRSYSYSLNGDTGTLLREHNNYIRESSSSGGASESTLRKVVDLLSKLVDIDGAMSGHLSNLQVGSVNASAGGNTPIIIPTGGSGGGMSGGGNGNGFHGNGGQQGYARAAKIAAGGEFAK